MDQVLIQIVMDDQGEVSLEYLADLVRHLPPEKIVKLLAHLAAELDKDAQELQAGLSCHSRLRRDKHGSGWMHGRGRVTG